MDGYQLLVGLTKNGQDDGRTFSSSDLKNICDAGRATNSTMTDDLSLASILSFQSRALTTPQHQIHQHFLLTTFDIEGMAGALLSD